MNVAIRTDASLRIGMGHAMRCLSLADALARDGATCTFISAAMVDAMAARIAARGHELIRITPDEGARGLDPAADAAAMESALSGRMPDWLVVDHYGIDADWHVRLRSFASRIAVIDDLADRQFDADLLVNQNAGAQAANYNGRLPSACRLLLGPANALLGAGFAAMRLRTVPRRRIVERPHLLVTMGGTDAVGASMQVLDALEASALPRHTRVTVVLGSVSPCLPQVRQIAATSRLDMRVAVDVEDMAGMLADTDIAIAAAGSTLWELCCLAVPTIAVITADNQKHSARALSASEAVLLVDDIDAIAAKVPALLQTLLSDGPRQQLSARASAVTDGLGSRRVAAMMINMTREALQTSPSR